MGRELDETSRGNNALSPPPLLCEPAASVHDTFSPPAAPSTSVTIDNIFAQMPAILWTVDRDLMITSSLGGGLKGINVRPYELVGKSLLDYLHTDDLEHPEVTRHKQVLAGETVKFESDVKGCILSCHMEPLRDSDGTITGCVGIALDVTHAHRMQLDLGIRNRILEITSSDRPLKQKFTFALQLLEGLYPGMHGSIMLLSPDGKILSLASGPSLPEALNDVLKYFEIGPEAGACGSAAFYGKQVIVESIAANSLFTPYRKFCEDLGYRACWSQPILSSKGRVLGTLAMYFTESKAPSRNEFEMLQWSANLLGTAIERERSDRFINVLMADLERSNREMSSFISVASHDMREPLRTMSSYMKQIEQKLEGHLDEETRIDMNFVSVSARRMQAMIKTLTEYSRVGNRKMLRNQITMADVIVTALQDLKTLIEETKAIVTYESTSETVGEAVLLARVVENLLTNAIRYRGPERPRIKISCHTRGSECHFTISDNGIGFDMKSATDIFQLFHRLNPAEEGSGLGLAVCKRIIETHGGRIWGVSVPGQGSTFSFTLPAYECAEEPGQAGRAPVTL